MVTVTAFDASSAASPFTHHPCRVLQESVDRFGLKVFSATKVRDRELLGETITEWIRRHSEYETFAKIVTQSSDAEFHCLTITVFYRAR